jgi:hypothetical protein
MAKKLPSAWSQGRPPVLSSPEGEVSRPQPQKIKTVPPTPPGGPGNQTGPQSVPATPPWAQKGLKAGGPKPRS